MAETTTQVTLRFKRGTSAEWAASPYVLTLGEPGYDTTVKRMKVGDGSTAWSQLKWQDVDTETLARVEAAADVIEDATGANDAVMTAVAANPASAFSTQLSTTFVRFVDQNGDPLPPGSVTTIRVNTVTGSIDDITFEEAV